jgi:peptidoglycan hydrolase CwlO-like protein
MTAGSRDTDTASLLENFLDANAEDIPPRIFSELDNLAAEIDESAGALHSEIDELNEEVADLKKQIEELEMK